MSKRRKGYPSERQVKRGSQWVHGDKELREKLGREDLCPCGSRRKVKRCCLKSGRFDGAMRHYFFQRTLDATRHTKHPQIGAKCGEPP